MKKARTVALSLAALAIVAGCTSEADKANENLSKEAERFRIERRIIGINGITDEILFSVQGYCSIENDGMKLDVICKTEDDKVERTTLGLSDNVTYVSTQLRPVKVDYYRPKIVFRPKSIIPDFDLATDED